MLQDRKTYAEWQSYLVEHLLRPVYAEWLGWMVLSGRLDLPGYDLEPERYREAVWIAPGQEWIDPQKEASANQTALETCQTTLQRICAAARGGLARRAAAAGQGAGGGAGDLRRTGK